MPLTPGQILNHRYRIDGLLRQGGFGTVYRAWDLNLNRPVALKENRDAAPAAHRQFEQEASLLSALHHPHLPRVTDYFFDPQAASQFLVMDFIEGEDLQQRLQRQGGPLPVAQALRWIEQVCAALEYLHRQAPPVIHRDVKPANIKIAPDGRAYLVDFGIAKMQPAGQPTGSGARAVSPGYSPPEQYGQGQTTPRSDLYALGATLYTLLTGAAPPDSVDRLSKAAPPPVPAERLNPEVSPAVGRAMRIAMNLRPGERFASVAEFRRALRVTVRVPPSRPRGLSWPGWLDRSERRWLAPAAIGLGVVCVLAAFLLPGQLRPRNAPALAATPAATAALERPDLPASPTLIPTLAASPTAAPEPTRTDVPTHTPVPSPTAALLPSPAPFRQLDSLGRSVEGRELALVQAGTSTGERVLVVVGGLDGTQADTRDLAQALADTFYADPGRLPPGALVYVVPDLNPDGNARNSRYNANGVDLNRNWETPNWTADPPAPGAPEGRAGAGGRAPFSEPETRRLSELLLSMQAAHSQVTLLVLHSTQQHAAGSVFAGYTDQGFDPQSVRLAQQVQSLLGYAFATEWDYGTPGEVIQWSAEHGIPAVDLIWPRRSPPTLEALVQLVVDFLQ